MSDLTKLGQRHQKSRVAQMFPLAVMKAILKFYKWHLFFRYLGLNGNVMKIFKMVS